MQECNFCHRSLPFECFYRDPRYKDRIVYQKKCKLCYHEKYRKDYTAAINSTICKQCGKEFWFNPQYSLNPQYCTHPCHGAAKASLDYNNSFIKPIKSWVDGLILSDLHIAPNGRFSWNLKHAEFSEFIANKFKEYQPSIKQQKNGIWSGRTKTHPDIKKERLRWYKENRKILPDDVIVNKDSLMALYLGDGSLHKIRGWIGIYTLNFSWDENELLCSKINQLGLQCRVKSANKKKQPHIYFSRPNAIGLLNYLETSPIQCYSYKFQMPSKEVCNAYQREARKKRQQNIQSAC